MFSSEELNELLKNKNVIKCSSKSISFSPGFKLRAVRKYYNDGCSASVIFKEEGLNLNIIGKDKAKDCLKRWRRIYQVKGEKGLVEEARGGQGRKKVKIEYRSDKDKIKYLEAKVAYLDAENDFLAKLRGLKRE